MKNMKRLYTVLTAMALTAMASFPAMAATETIEDVSLTIDSEVYAEYDDSYVDVEADTEGCYIDSDDVVFTNEPSSGWDEDDTPKIKIVVQADDGYRFKSSKWDNDDIDIDGDGIELGELFEFKPGETEETVDEEVFPRSSIARINFPVDVPSLNKRYERPE